MGLCSSKINKTTRNETGTTSAATTTVERQGSGRQRREKDLTSGGEINEAEQLVGRLVGNGSSELACLYTQQGSKGTNQDAMLVWEVCFSPSLLTMMKCSIVCYKPLLLLFMFFL